MVVSPEQALWERVLRRIREHGDEADMDIVNAEFKMDLLTLNAKYAALDVAIQSDTDSLAWYGSRVEDAIEQLYVVHFTGHKPWSVQANPNAGWAVGTHPQYFKLFETWHQHQTKVC